ncbi:MAG: hypothetical protein OXT63_09240 [Gemmatimonadota bacterium]|nr:hypothetical protein [Gemmatimonadota bacterium]
MIAHLKGRDKALEAFGWTGRKAEWIALACLHSGVFTRAQLAAWLRTHNRTARRFVLIITAQKLAVEELLHGRRICRIFSRPVYRALGAEHIRHRKTASEEVLLRRLLSLDYVIEHPGLPWLPTEPEKVGAFEALGIERAVLPVRVYGRAARETRRYFPVKLPVALDERRALFVYADPGHDTATALRSWGGAHRKLWRALLRLGLAVEVAAVVRTAREAARARKVLGHWVEAAAEANAADPARREIARIEQAILGMDDAEVERLGGFQSCLMRIAELKKQVRSACPGTAITGFTAWRSGRLRGGVS